MGEPQADPNKPQSDPSKAEDNKNSPDPAQDQGEVGRTFGEIIGVYSGKAGDGISSAFQKTGDKIRSSANRVGTGKGLVQRTGPNAKQKKNPQRAAEQKKFDRRFQPIAREEPKDTNMVGNITKLLPSNTFLMFQTLAPLATNDGNCHQTEKLMTSIVLFILATTCMAVCFTDTFQYNGKVYHGIVTWSGLWNPSLKGDPSLTELRQYECQLAKFYEARNHYKRDKREALKDGLKPPDRPVEPVKPTGPLIMGSKYSSGNKQYCLNFTDFLHAILSALAFGTLTLLTSPVSTCFYPDIPSTVVKTLPLLMGFVISAIFAFSPPARNGIAHPLPPKTPTSLVVHRAPDPKGIEHAPQLPPQPPPPKGMISQNQKKDDDDDNEGNFFDMMKHVAGNVMHNTVLRKEASDFVNGAASAAMQLSKEVHLPAAIQAAANSTAAEALMDAGKGVMNGGGSQALATAKDAVIQIQQDVQTSPISHLLKQPSMALAHANSLMQQAGSAISPLAAHEANALYNHAAQALNTSQLSRQLSGLPSTLSSAGPNAAALAFATGQAMVQAGYIPGSAAPYFSDQLLKHQASLAAQDVGNQIQNLSQGSVKTLARDMGTLVQQNSQSLNALQDELGRQQSALTQGLNAQWQALYAPGLSMAQDATSLVQNGYQTLSGVHDQIALQQAALAQGTLNTQLASSAARGMGTLLQQGADGGMVSVQDELLRQKAALIHTANMQVQGLLQPAASLAQNATLVAKQGSQTLTNVENDLTRQKSVLTEELNKQLTALSGPATSVAQDVTALVGGGSKSLNQLQDEASQKAAGLTSQLVDSMAQDVGSRLQQAAIMQYQNPLHQPPGSVAIDIASLVRKGNQTLQQPVLSQGLNASLQALYQSHASAALAQAASSQLQQSAAQQYSQPLQTMQQAVDNHVRQLASLSSFARKEAPILMQGASTQFNPLPVQTLIGSKPAQQLASYVKEAAGPSQGWSDLTIKDITDVAGAAEKKVESLHDNPPKLPTSIEIRDRVGDVMADASESQAVKAVVNAIVASTAEVVQQQIEKGMTASRGVTSKTIDSASEEISSALESGDKAESSADPVKL